MVHLQLNASGSLAVRLRMVQWLIEVRITPLMKSWLHGESTTDMANIGARTGSFSKAHLGAWPKIALGMSNPLSHTSSIFQRAHRTSQPACGTFIFINFHLQLSGVHAPPTPPPLQCSKTPVLSSPSYLIKPCSRDTSTLSLASWSWTDPSEQTQNT